MTAQDPAARPQSYAEIRAALDEQSDIRDVCRRFQKLTGLNIVVDADIRPRVDVDLKNVPWDQALDLILQQHDLTYVLQGNLLRVTTRAKALAEAEKLIALRRTREWRQ